MTEQLAPGSWSAGEYPPHLPIPVKYLGDKPWGEDGTSCSELPPGRRGERHLTTSRAKRMTPQLHMSARRPSYFSPWKGARPAMTFKSPPGSLHPCPLHLLHTHLNHLWTCIVRGPEGEMWHESQASFSPLPGTQEAGPRLTHSWSPGGCLPPAGTPCRSLRCECCSSRPKAGSQASGLCG